MPTGPARKLLCSAPEKTQPDYGTDTTQFKYKVVGENYDSDPNSVVVKECGQSGASRGWGKASYFFEVPSYAGCHSPPLCDLRGATNARAVLEESIAPTLCYAIVLPGRKSACRAGFLPDCYRENTKTALRPADVVSSRYQSGQNLVRNADFRPGSINYCATSNTIALS